MRNVIKMVLLGALSTAWQLELIAQNHDHTASDTIGHTMLHAAEFTWMDAPPGLPKGARVAVLAGDPAKAGPFTIRVKFPANYAVKPHWHPTAENITVIDGALFMGTQEIFDKQQAGKLEKGDFAAMPAKFVHFAFCNDPTIVQIHGMGPFAIHYINKNDDPRNEPLR